MRRAGGVMAWGAAGIASLLALAGCDVAPPEQAPPAPEATVEAPALAPAPPPPPAPSEASQLLRLYFARAEAEQLSQGLMRADRAPADAPFTAAMLARDFVRIALFDENTTAGGSVEQSARLADLRRWDVPVRIGIEFGSGIPADQADRDRASVTAYAARLQAASGHPIRVVTAVPNFHVLFLTEDERLAIAPRLEELAPRLDPGTVRAVVNLPRNVSCAVIGLSGGGKAYTGAIAIIRAELPNLSRLSCIHEEIAQGLGLVNDSRDARPSIFNDNEEFALLTLHDEYLLKILYDPRLTPGMSAAEAASIARLIADEVMAVPPA